MSKNNKTTPNVPTLRFKEFSDPWHCEKIGDACSLSSGTTPSRIKGNNFGGNICWLTSGELKNKWVCGTEEKITKETFCECNLTLFPENTLIIAIYGLEAIGVRGTCSILKTPSTISQACMAIQPKNENVSVEFLYSWYKKHGNLIGVKYAQGTKQQNLCFDIVKGLSVHYPSIKEQQKIAAFVDSIDRRIDIQNKIISKYESLIKGIRHNIFSLVNGEKQNTLGHFLHEYSEKNVGNNLQSVAVGKYGIRKRDEIYSKELSADYSKNKVIHKNTLIIGMGSTQIDIGILTTDEQFCVSPAYTTYKIEGIDSCYLQEYLIELNPLLSVRYMITSARQGKAVNKEDLMKHLMNIHSKEDQEQISQCFEELYRRLRTEKEMLSALQKQKAFLLHTMFI